MATLLNGQQKSSVILADSTDLGDSVTALGDKIIKVLEAVKSDKSQSEALTKVADQYKNLIDSFQKTAQAQAHATIEAMAKIDQTLEAKDFQPKVKVEAPQVTVPSLNIKPIKQAISSLEAVIKDNKAEIPPTDFSGLEESVKATTKAINSLKFPVANYVLPFTKDGKATQVVLDTNGAVPVSGSLSGGGDGAILDGVSSSIKATVADLTNSNPLAVEIVDGSGTQITSFGGGTQYTEDAAAAADPVGTAPILVRKDTPSTTVTTDGDNIAQRGTNYGAAYVTLLDTSGSAVSVGGGTQYDEDTASADAQKLTMAGVTRADTAATQVNTDGDRSTLIVDASGKLHVNPGTVTVASHAVTNAGTFVVQENGAALTALQLIDDTVATLGTTTYSEATTKGNVMGAVRRDANTTLVDTTNEVAPLQVNATGELKVAQIQALPAGANAIGKLAANDGVDIGDVTINNASGGSAVNIQDGGNSITVDGAVTTSGTVTEASASAIKTAVELIDDVVYTDDTSTHSTGTSKGAGIMAVANPTDAAVDANDIGMVAMTLARAMKNDITTIAGTAPTTVGKLDVKGADGDVFVRQATASNLNMTEASAASTLTSVQLIDDMIYTDDTSTHSTGTSKGALIMGAATPTDTAVNANDIGAIGMTNNREMYVSLRDNNGTATASGSGTAAAALRVELPTNGTGVVGLNAGTNSIGKLATNSGVTIGAVEIAAAQTLATVTTVSTVTNLSQMGGQAIALNTGTRSAGTQRVTIATDDVVPASQSGTWTVQPGNTPNSTPWLTTDTPSTTGGLSKFHLVGAASDNVTNVKASAGQVYSITAFNVAATPRYLKFHNTAGTPTAGTGVTDTYLIPGNTAGAGVVINLDKGIAFGTGIGISIVTGIADNSTTAIGASEVVINVYYK